MHVVRLNPAFAGVLAALGFGARDDAGTFPIAVILGLVVAVMVIAGAIGYARRPHTIRTAVLR